MNYAGAILWLMLMGAIYLAPTWMPIVVAKWDDKRPMWPTGYFWILALNNILWGWTVIGWFFCWIYALFCMGRLFRRHEKQREINNLLPSFENLKKCPFCTAVVLKEAKVCKRCGRKLPVYRPFVGSFIE